MTDIPIVLQRTKGYLCTSLVGSLTASAKFVSQIPKLNLAACFWIVLCPWSCSLSPPWLQKIEEVSRTLAHVKASRIRTR